MKKIFILSIILGGIIVPANAQIIKVTADKSTIQAGIDSASTGDTVLVSEGTYYENINFKGKAITVSSQFILDGDPSHISKTVINGSQPLHPDTASVVLMRSGEDTTSVLMGFTITGGRGTVFTLRNNDLRGGGGILIFGSGGSIVNNIIEANDVSNNYSSGGGIAACAWSDKIVIIRKNKIDNNTLTNAPICSGGGIYLDGGGFIIEGNSISGNEITGTTEADGGGIISYLTSDSQPFLIIRNNLISENSCMGAKGYGGGIYNNDKDGKDIKIYNNLIIENHATRKSGGIVMGAMSVAFFNNTLWHNEADLGPNSIGIGVTDAEHVICNNIIWGADNGQSDVDIREGAAKTNILYNNILRDSVTEDDPVLAEGNIYDEPQFFSQGSFRLAEFSPGIGRGLDSVMSGSTWYYAPSTDFEGKVRPDTVDQYVDIGAIESTFRRTDTTSIGIHEDVGLSVTDPILIYPNPANNLITIESTNSGLHTIEITSMNGCLLRCMEMVDPTLQVDLSSFQKGIYFITVRSRDFVRTEKVIKL